MTDATNRWRYSGKEEQKTLNSSLPFIDYGARMYDPTIARWMSVDPMAEKYYPMSPYGYCGGNPIRYSDRDGYDWWDKVKGFGAAIIDNATSGVSSIRTYAGRNVTDQSDFNKGLSYGDAASIALGSIEGGFGSGMIESGGGIAIVGLATEVPSAGTSSVIVLVGGAEVAVGSAMAGHGTMMMAQGSKNYSEKKGYLGNSTPKNSDQINSKTLWKGKKGERIDVENPKNREGNIHYHDKSGK